MKNIEIWGGQFSVLSEEQQDRIHYNTLDLLSRTGCMFEDRGALEIFEAHGADVDFSSKIVRIPSHLIEAAISSAPAKIRLSARNSINDIQLERNRVYFGPGTVAVNVLDLETGQRRPGSFQDAKDFPRLIDALDHIHFYKGNIYPSDVPKMIADLHMLYGGFSNTEKQISCTMFSLESAIRAVEMAEVVAGGSKMLKRRPLLTVNVLSTSPLEWAKTNLQILMELAKRGVPLIIGSEPQAGSTAPVTLAAAILLQNAEAIAGITLAQLINPGTPVLYGAIGSISDMSSGQYASGGVELGLMNVAATQMSKYYEIPIYATGGMSDSKTTDVQAGYEKALQILMIALGGGNYIHDSSGLLEFCLTTSYEQMVIDNEICGMAIRALRGINIDDTSLAVDLIDRVGPGGNFLAEEHTVKYFRQEHFLPKISNRKTRQMWESQDRAGALEQSREVARDILKNHRPEPLKEDVDSDLKAILKEEHLKRT